MGQHDVADGEPELQRRAPEVVLRVMQVADAVLRPPRERDNCLVRPRMDRQVSRVIRRRRRQRDADQQIKGRVGTSSKTVDVPAFAINRSRASSRRVREPDSYLHLPWSIVGPEQAGGMGRDEGVEACVEIDQCVECTIILH